MKEQQEPKFGLKESDREILIGILQRLELYVENKKAYDLMPADKLMDQKFMIWGIKEIYQSPHNVLLGKLKRDKMLLKYTKTKEYITQKSDYQLIEIISYYIVCLHEELEEMK